MENSMGTKQDDKKARERWLLDHYLQCRKIVQYKVKAGERPDFVVTAYIDGMTKAIGIELCEFQLDALAVGGAGSRSRRSFHNCLMEALQGQGFDLTTLCVHLNYDEGNTPRRAEIGPLATELVLFRRQKEALVPSFCENPSGFSFLRGEEHFNEFPLLQKYVFRVDFARPFAPGAGYPTYNDSAGSRLEVPAGPIRNLMRKHLVAKWPESLRDLPLKWLVICAGVETAYDMIGPNLGIVTQSLDALAPEAAACGFDLVTFWECRAGWEHPIWHAGGT
jgi:hypothetical protein